MAAIRVGSHKKGPFVWVILIAALVAASPVLAESEADTASSDSAPRMTKPAAAIDESGSVVVVKSKLVNWMDKDLSDYFESGLPLRLSFKAAIFEARDYWLDAQLASTTVKKQVSFDPVKKSYTVIVLEGEEEISEEFVDKKEAMQRLLTLETEIPLHLFMEKHPERTYYAGVYCDVTAGESDFPVGRLLWFLRTGYTTEWFYSEKISTQVLQGDDSGKKQHVGQPDWTPKAKGGTE